MKQFQPILLCLLLLTRAAHGEDTSFTHQAAATNAANLCLLARHYCDLTFATNSTAAQKDLIARAVTAAEQAVQTDPSNATAHATLAVCYAKSCAYAKIKARLNYSRLFKLEAEKTIALDPKQDIAWYLLGRWNYELTQVGLLSRAVVTVVYGGLPDSSNADAIKDYQKAIALAPNRILHHAGLAMVYRATGETKQETAELEKCCALKPADHEDLEAIQAAKQRLADLHH